MVELELARRLERGQEVVLATVIRMDGEPPSHSGAKLLLDRSTALAGTLGCSEFDAAAVADAAAVLETAAPQSRTYHHDLGTIEVYLEPHQPAPMLLVLGATPVARQLLAWAPGLGFWPLLLETRPERLGSEQWPAPVVTELADLAARLGQDLYAVHTDHDAPDLVEALRILIDREPRFLGLMGSRRHTGHHLEALRAAGVDEAQIAAIRTPVGLDLGSVTAAEIALSILAGLVAVRRGGSGGWKG